MEALKLTILDEKEREFKAKLKMVAKNGHPYREGNCSCPCSAFIKKGEVIMDDIRSTASWNID